MLIDALCDAHRPESILTWMRRPQVVDLLTGLMTGAVACSHDALDEQPRGKAVEHIRSILEHHDLLTRRDHYLALFEHWLTEKELAAGTAETWAIVHRFATWHHLRRIRAASRAGQVSEGAVRAAKQEITEVIKFLNWLHTTHHRSAETATQRDVDAYLRPGPTTRYAIRTFFVWCRTTGLNASIEIAPRTALNTPTLTDEQRLTWINTLMTGDITTLHQRVAGLLLLLYAQPLVKIVTLQIGDLELTPTEMRIRLGTAPVPVPEPFAILIYQLLAHRPNLHTAGSDTMYLFPGSRPGRHMHSQNVTQHLRLLGVSLYGSRNSALRNLIQQAPAPIVADMLGYSYHATARHNELAATTYARYAQSLTDTITTLNT